MVVDLRRLILMVGVVLFVSSIPATTMANDLSGRWGIGLGWPYLSLKYGINPKVSIEGIGAFGEGIGCYGGRLYYNFNPYDRTVLSTGIEADYVSFDVGIKDEKEGMKGGGFMGYLFVGGEYFFSDNFTLNLDIGPAYISLPEGKFKLNVSGIEWLANLGVKIYLGSSVREKRP